MGKPDCCQVSHDVGCRVCEHTLFIPNWFDRVDCEELLGRRISDVGFEDFIEFYEDEVAEDVSNMVRTLLFRYFKGEEPDECPDEEDS